MIRTLIFDLDGTLADTINAIRSGINLAMEALGYPTKTREEIRAAINHGARALVRNCMPEAERGDEDKVTHALAVYQDFYATTFRETDRLYDGMEETLVELHRRGYTVAVFSNKQDEFVVELAKNLVPAGLCALARGQRPGAKAKPDREVSLGLCRELCAAPSECAFIGDSHVDIQTAKNAGFLAVGVAWGYRPEVLAAEGADHIVDRPADLLDLFPPLAGREA
ncbi:MAG: HAD family hydrolase [Clostridia bacterium]|nr:HAD family hydrolase [Clostridia bacterium]